MFNPTPPRTLDEVPRYQQSLYLTHLGQLQAHGLSDHSARAHARAAAWRAAELARDAIEKRGPEHGAIAPASSLKRPRGERLMHILPHADKKDDAAKKPEAKEAAKKPESVFHYRMDELSKAKDALHLAADVMDDEHQIAKIKKAEKLAKEVRAEEKKKGPAPEAPKSAEGKK